VFKRRNPIGWLEWLKEQVYPKRGFKRQIAYVWHRLRRLPDPPHRIARGVFAGTFVNFPPILGVQMLSAAGLAWVMRGNIIAALLATFLSNPVTTPLIAWVSLETGYWMLGIPGHVNLEGVYDAFVGATSDLWNNVLAMFGPEKTHWGGLLQFWQRIYLPYLVGSILPGIAVSLICYWLTIPALTAYQALRRRRLAARYAALRKKVAAKEGDVPPVNP
jgi:uncharacterized protein (DUF2062 family)